MVNRQYVLDANVFLEYIFGRPLEYISRQLLKSAILKQIKVIVPSILLDEVTEVLCGNLNNTQDIQKHLNYIEHLVKENIINIIVPNCKVRMKAIEIARSGNPKSGHPELTDSLYHALAILNGAVFITNDIKHIGKVKQFGHIKKLADISK
jgi:predicted nucleic acid-binding protein